MKNHQRVVLTILIVVAFGTTSLVLSASDDKPNGQLNINKNQELVKNSLRSKFVLPRLFEFEQYQKFFDKHYKSIKEKAIRAKLYLGRAFRVFISVVSYKHGKSSMYLSVNQMSDRTPAEIKQMFLNDKVILGANSAARDDSKPKTSELLQASQPYPTNVPDVQTMLDEVVERDENNPVLEDLAKELGKIESSSISEEKSLYKPEIVSDVVAADSDSIELKTGSQEDNSIGFSMATPILDSLIGPFNWPPPINQQAETLPDVTYVDHRNCLGPAQSQGQCGACFAFSTLALYEWAYCKATNRLVYFSKQYVVDCGDSRYLLNGCNGGSPMYLGLFLTHIGFLLENEYPYLERKTQCPYSSQLDQASWGSVRIYVEGFALMSLTTIEENLKVAPLVMIVMVDLSCSKMIEYGGGVDNEIYCTGTRDSTHAMLLVGSGREDGHEYFLFRNSYGTAYGENGHYKMNKKHTSLINNEGLVVKFADKPVIDETYFGERISEKIEKNNQMKLKMYGPSFAPISWLPQSWRRYLI